MALKLNFSWLIDGKLAGSRGPSSTDHLSFMWDQGIRALVRMSDAPKIRANEVENIGMVDFFEPVPDMMAPTKNQIDHMLGFINDQITHGKSVGISCDGGIGRTATVLACYLIMNGFSSDNAIKLVKTRRPGSILTIEQEDAVRTYELRRLDQSSTINSDKVL